MDGGVGWITYTRSVYLNRSHGNRKVLAIHIPSFDPGLPPQSTYRAQTVLWATDPRTQRWVLSII